MSFSTFINLIQGFAQGTLNEEERRALELACHYPERERLLLEFLISGEIPRLDMDKKRVADLAA